MKMIKYSIIIVAMMHTLTTFSSQHIDLTSGVLPELTIPQPNYTNFHNLVRGKAALLKSLVAQEQSGKPCAALKRAEKELHREFCCGKNEIFSNSYDTETVIFVLSIAEKSVGRKALIAAIDSSTYYNMIKTLKENHFVANAYGPCSIYSDRIVTPLHYVLCKAAETKDERYKSSSSVYAHMLLNAKANPNAIDDAGNTPLHHASLVDHILLLWEFGADNNKQNELGQTPLINHIRIHNWDIARCLIDGGAEINIQDNEGNSALHEAVKQEDLEIVDLLLRKGADYSVSNKKGKKPIDKAHNRPQIKELIQEFLRLSLCHALKNNDAHKVFSLMSYDIANTEIILEWAKKFYPQNFDAINMLVFGHTPIKWVLNSD